MQEYTMLSKRSYAIILQWCKDNCIECRKQNKKQLGLQLKVGGHSIQQSMQLHKMLTE
jgi:hypothetical protein